MAKQDCQCLHAFFKQHTGFTRPSQACIYLSHGGWLPAFALLALLVVLQCKLLSGWRGFEA